MISLEEFMRTKLDPPNTMNWESIATYLGEAQKINFESSQVQYYIEKELSNEEYEEYCSARALLGRYMINRELFQILEKNHEQYRNTLANTSMSVQSLNEIDWRYFYELKININNCILNFLCATRTYLDHTQTSITREHGNKSDKFKSFKSLTSKAYDNNISYRFVYKLRDFTQHCGMPLGNVQFKSNIIDKETKDVEKQIEFLYDRDYLLDSFSNWKHVKKDLAAMPRYFPISIHIDEMMKELRFIDASLLKRNKNQLAKLINQYDDLLTTITDDKKYDPYIYMKITCELNSEGYPNYGIEGQRINLEHLNEIRETYKSLTTLKDQHQNYIEGWDRIFSDN